MYTVTDPSGLTDTATVTVTITGSNDTPTAVDGSITVVERGTQSLDVTSLISDPDGDTLTVTIATNPSLGAATVSGNTVTYDLAGTSFAIASAGQDATDSIVYRVTDPSGATATGTIAVTITNSNDNPVGADVSSYTAIAGGDSVTIDLSSAISDPDGVVANLSISIATNPEHATSPTVSGQVVTYIPPAAGVGSVIDTFTYRVTDSLGGSDTGTISVNVIDPSLADGVSTTCEPGIETLPTSACSIQPTNHRIKVYGFGLCTEAITLPISGYSFPDSCHLIFNGLDAGEQYVTLGDLDSTIRFSGDLSVPPFDTYTHGFLLIDNAVEVKGQLTLGGSTTDPVCYIEAGMTVACYASTQPGKPAFIRDEIDNFYNLNPRVYQFSYSDARVDMFLLDSTGTLSTSDVASQRILAVQELSAPADFSAATRSVEIGVHVSKSLTVNGSAADTAPFKITFTVD